MKMLPLLIAMALLGSAGAAVAAEPVRLADASLDTITAGAVRTVSQASTSGTFAFGRAGRISEASTSRTIVRTSRRGTTIDTTSTATGSTWSIGPGATGSGGGGFVFVAVTRQ